MFRARGSFLGQSTKSWRAISSQNYLEYVVKSSIADCSQSLQKSLKSFKLKEYTELRISYRNCWWTGRIISS